MHNFEGLHLIEPLLKAVAAEGYSVPTPIQIQAVPPLLQGRDLFGCAQTGTGKTAAFALPILQQLSAQPGPRNALKVLVLAPTRELATQIHESFESYGAHLKFRSFALLGGVSARPQIEALRRGLDILVATPGRLLDLSAQGFVSFRDVRHLVLDEADRMLDMGFIHDIRKILALLPSKRQNLLFSATMPPQILELANGFLRDPVHVEVSPPATTVERIDQRVMFVERSNKPRLLAKLVEDERVVQAIVFTRTKHGANRLVAQLDKLGIPSMAIHGNKAQTARMRALAAFKSGQIPLLVATDIAARGLDIDGVSHVFNFDLPNECDAYVHRIGRTGRAGRDGQAIAFCDLEEAPLLRDIEKHTGRPLERANGHAWHCAAAAERMEALASGGGRGSTGQVTPKRGSQSAGSGRRAGGPSTHSAWRDGAPRHAPAQPHPSMAQGTAGKAPPREGGAPPWAPRDRNRDDGQPAQQGYGRPRTPAPSRAAGPAKASFGPRPPVGSSSGRGSRAARPPRAPRP